MIDFNKLQEIIISNNHFIITTHVNPDADAIGSEMAVYQILKLLKKKVCVINYTETPYYLEFLDEDGIIEVFDAEKHFDIISSTDVIIAVDINRASRTIKMENAIVSSTALKLCIDHHEDPDDFMDFYFGETGYSSSGQIVYDFIKNTNVVDFTKSIAIPIYAAIMTDTGSFRYDRTTPEVHLIASHLLELGASPFEIYRKIYDESKIGKLKLLGKALGNLEVLGQKKKLAVMQVTQNDLEESGALETDTDGFISFCLSVENVVMGLFFLELNDGFKVSLRSKGNVYVHKLAGIFGGGGHKNASGLRIKDKSMSDMKETIIGEALKMLEDSPAKQYN